MQLFLTASTNTPLTHVRISSRSADARADFRAELSVLVGPNVLQGNGGGSIGDVNCDAFSQVFGDVSGVATNKCSLQGNGK